MSSETKSAPFGRHRALIGVVLLAVILVELSAMLPAFDREQRDKLAITACRKRLVAIAERLPSVPWEPSEHRWTTTLTRLRAAAEASPARAALSLLCTADPDPGSETEGTGRTGCSYMLPLRNAAVPGSSPVLVFCPHHLEGILAVLESGECHLFTWDELGLGRRTNWGVIERPTRGRLRELGY